MYSVGFHLGCGVKLTERYYSDAKVVPHFSLQWKDEMMLMVPGSHKGQRAGKTRYALTVKMSHLCFLLVVLQVGQDPSRWA